MRASPTATRSSRRRRWVGDHLRGEVPENYIPWWLRPVIRPMTRVMVEHFTPKHLANLSAMAEAAFAAIAPLGATEREANAS